MSKKKKELPPKFYASPLNNPMLNYAVYYMSAFEKTASFLVTFVLGGLAGQVFYGGLFKVDGEATTATTISNIVVFIIVGLIAAKFFVPAVNNMLKENRDKALKRQFMDLLECLNTSLSAGNTMHGAMMNARSDLQNQYADSDYIMVELAEIISGMNNGMNLEEMIANFGVRSANEDIMNFSNVISNCYRLGGNFSDVVRHTREIISDKIMVADEIETKISSNKLQHNAMALMPIALVAMLKVASPEFAANLSSFLGVIMTTVAIGIFVGSYFWGQKIINIG